MTALAERWKVWRDPQARQARKRRRRRDWNEALSQAQARARKRGPSYGEIYSRGKPRR